MSREIKFRFWVENSKFMTEGTSIKDIFIYKDQVLNNIIMQFTGFKDKNGVDIYEGDKIKYKNFKGYSKIIFESGAFGYYGASCFITLLETNVEYIEVIGNIYE